MRIPDGYVDGGHAMKIAGDGTVSSQREIITVDRTRDTKLRQHLDYVHWLMRGNLPPLQRATLIAQYVDQQYSPADGRNFSEEACTRLLESLAGKEVLIGDIIRAGVCRHRALVFKLLADEAGLSVALVRGHLGEQAYHAWNELTLAGGEKLIVDAMNPQPGFIFPKTTDRAASAYRTVDDKPYYAKSPATAAAGTASN
jgi:transglutaminase/protease-like cytokinesis protein 3